MSDQASANQPHLLGGPGSRNRLVVVIPCLHEVGRSLDDVGQGDQGLEIRRVDQEGLLELFGGLCEAALLQIHAADRPNGREALWIAVGMPLVGQLRVVQAALVHIGLAEQLHPAP